MFKQILVIIFCSFFLTGCHNNMNEPYFVYDNNAQTLLPRNLRMTTFPLKKTSTPSILGLKDLHAMASGQFSLQGLEAVQQEVKAKVWVVDLRRESHGFINEGRPVSWYALGNHSNENKSADEIDTVENQKLNALLNHTTEIKKILSKTSGRIEKVKKYQVPIHQVWTEKEVVERLHLHYLRLPVLDHNRPDDKTVNHFVNWVKTLSPNDWVYFHCRAGKGRSTTLMAMYDMLHNAHQVSFEDIIERQYLLGGVNLAKKHFTIQAFWKKGVSKERLVFLKAFYDYAKAQDGYQSVSWSEWTSKHPTSL